MNTLNTDRWVPVAERLPPRQKPVLVIFDNGHSRKVRIDPCMGPPGGAPTGFVIDLCESGNVTHWLEWPELPPPARRPRCHQRDLVPIIEKRLAAQNEKRNG